MKKILITIVVALCILGLAQCGYAQDAGRKLLRGLGNVATGWMEIPNQMYKESTASNVVVGLTWGTLKGAGWTVVRTVTGAYEIATFPFPIPSGYEPIVKPEFVFSKEESAAKTEKK